MGLPRFGPPDPKAAAGGGGGDSKAKKTNQIISSPNLYVANCGPAVGLSHDTIASVFASFGDVHGVYAADDSGARVVVCYNDDSCAAAALAALHGRPCPQLAGRILHIRYSMLRPSPTTVDSSSVRVCLSASETEIPGLYLLPDFITPHEEQELLAAVDARPWISLAKRRVQHYGYQFCYQTRNVNTKQHMGELPSFVSLVLERISSFPNLTDAADVSLDQLTVNEYPPGVGLSPHIDTHSAFEGLIFSLSLAGPCIMEFRRYEQGAWFPKAGSSIDTESENSENCTNFSRRAIYLPPRSMLLLSGEARLAWHHYIPHHKIDIVNDSVIKRSSRRVSFTIRKVRTSPCQCQFPQYCDSQR
uniref:RNA-binding (RRM/RBD/RNP motifs) family protein n=1 Tax=Geranium maderense TaxID=28964 RepID=A0A0G4AML3_9ROSI|nr:RNA-binding (RRM/RBD/RNP motifs) family protein [Geranium maderense]